MKYKSSLDAFSQILKNKGVGSLFKNTGVNILHVVAGIDMFARDGKLQRIIFDKKDGSGGS